MATKADIWEQMRAVSSTSDKTERDEFSNPDAVLRMEDLLALLRSKHA